MGALYVALGDSLTAGYGVRPGLGFAERYHGFLQSQGRTYRLLNLGVNGLTVSGMHALLQQSKIATSVSQAELITLTIGSNDLLNFGRSLLQISNFQGHGSQVNVLNLGSFAPAQRNGPEAFLLNFSSHLDGLGQQLRRLNPQAFVQVANLYNPLPAGPYAQFSEQAQPLLNQANKALLHWGKRYGFQVLRVDRIFRGKETILLGPDRIHPNAQGYEAMALMFANRWS